MDDFKNRRRNYYIKKKFQTNFVIKFCVIALIGAFLSGGLVWWMARTTVTTTFDNSRLVIKSTADFILPSIMISGAMVVVLTVFATIFLTLFISHRIAGPLYRVEKDLQELRIGNLNIRFRIRTSDELKPLASSLDDLAQDLRNRVVEIKSALGKLEADIEKPGSNVSMEARRTLREATEAVNKFYT